MAEVASLVLAIDSGQVAPAVAELNKLDAAAAKVATSVDKTEKEVREFGNAARSMSDSVSSTVTRFEQFGAAGARMSASFDQAGAAFGRFQSGVASVGATFGTFTRDFRAVAPAAQSAANAINNAGNTAARAANGFGLARHQVTNLVHQFQDVAVSLGSGQSFATVLLQQGPQITSAMGGVSNSIGIVKDAIGRIPTAVKVAGAGLGIVGAVGAAAAALANLNADIEKTEAKIRTFNTPDTANSIIKTSKASAAGTGLDPSTLTNLEQLAQRQRQQLGLLDKDLGTLSSSAAKLAVQMKATGEQSAAAIGTLTNLLQQTTITGAEAVRFAQAFPQFAGAMAKAFDVPLDKLLDLDPAIMRTNAAVAQAVVQMGEGASVAPSFSKAMNDLGNAVTNAAIGFEKLTGLGASFTAFMQTTAREIEGIASLFNKMAQAASDATAASQAAIAAAPAAQGMTPGMARRATIASGGSGLSDGPMGPFDPRDVQGPPIPEEIGIKPSSVDSIAQKIQDAVGLPADTGQIWQNVENEIKRTADFGQQGLQATSNGFARVYDASQMGVAAANATKLGVDQNTSSTRDGLKSVEQAVNRAAAMTAAAAAQGRVMQADGRWSEAGKGDGWHTGSTGGMVYDFNDLPNHDTDGDGFQTTNSWAGKQGTHVMASPAPLQKGMDWIQGDVGNWFFTNAGGPRARNRGDSSADRAAFDKYNANTEALFPAIGGAMPPMPANNNTGMTSAPAPDPYKMRNPDYFYNNTTGQVSKEKSQAEALRSLPKDIAREIAEALVKAGLVGEKIGEAIVQAGTRPTAAPTPQDGWLINRGPIRGNYGPSMYNRTALR